MKTSAAPARLVETAEGFVVHQNNHESYVVKLTAGDLVDVIEVATCDPTTPEGYQRPESKKRINDIAAYVENGGEIPPAVLLSARRKPIDHGKGRYGWQVPFYAVDGQHRLGGLREAITRNPKLKNFEIACVIKAGLSIEEEAQLFMIVNRTQMKVSNSLTQTVKLNLSKSAAGKDLLEETPESLQHNEWEIRATKLALLLNIDSGISPMSNPLKGHIKLTNSDKDPIVRHAVSQGTVVRSLQQAVLDDGIKGIDQRSIGRYLIALWSGVALAWSKAVANPDKHYIVRTLGVEIINRSFPFVYRTIKEHSGDVTNPSHYAKVLSLSDGWAGKTFTPWSISHPFTSASTSSSWYADRADEFIQQIKNNEFALIKGF